MTYAIETAYIGPSNTRGSRIRARVMERGNGQRPRSLTLTWDGRLGSQDNHREAARALAVKLGWDGRWIEGGADKGASVWVREVVGHNDSFTVEA